MTIEVLGIIDNLLSEAGINYEYLEWTSDMVYPYWVGDYQEVEPLSEDGMCESTFIMSGFTRSTALELEQDKEKIKKLFDETSGKLVTTDNGSVVAIFYANALPVRNENMDLKSMTINLKVKEWKGEKRHEKIRN